MKAKKIILDTNFLLIPGQFHVDIFSEIEKITEKHDLYIMKGSLEELNKLAKGTSKTAQAAKLGFVLSKQKGLKTLQSSESHVDDAIVSVVDQNTIVCTQDKDLKKRVKDKGGSIITMRQKKYLVKEG